MIRLGSLEVYSSILNINTTNKKFELYTDNFHKFSFIELKVELEEILNISDNTPYHLPHEMIGPRIIQAHRKLRLEKSSTSGYIIILLGYARSPFRDFKINLRIVIGSDENDIEIILKQYNEKFITYELSPGIYTIKDSAKLFTQKAITKGLYKLNIMMLPWKRNLF